MSLFTQYGRSLILAAITAVVTVCVFGCGGSATGGGGGSITVIDPGECSSGTITDSRDDKTYKTVTIGGKTWMAENLNYQTDNSWCLYDEDSNCDKCGKLYDWDAALSVCPDGWHLPTVQEWNELIGMVGGKKNDGKSLRSKDSWKMDGNGTDDYGFSALPCGNRSESGDYYQEYSDGIVASWWTATETKSDKANATLMSPGGTAGKSIIKGIGMSVRCVQN
jgi:uncharacterized protein (TIGR02145 family)